MTFRILVVCTANVCRSPLVAMLLARRLATTDAGRDVLVESAGLDAVPGLAACAEMTRVAAAHHLPVAGLGEHRAHPITIDQVALADLVLTSDRGVRSAVVRMVPSVAPHTFTVREAAALAERIGSQARRLAPEERLRSCVSAMNAGRGLTELPRTRRVPALPGPWRPLSVHDHDIPDAHQHDLAPHRVVYRLAVGPTRQLGRSLSDPAGSWRR